MVGWVGLEPTISETPNLQSGAVPIVPPPHNIRVFNKNSLT